jgi:hypothetical protein
MIQGFFVKLQRTDLIAFDKIVKLFATNDSYDEIGNSTGRSIVEIDINTGNVNVLGQLSAFPNFVGGSSQFDQNSGTFLLAGGNR